MMLRLELYKKPPRRSIGEQTHNIVGINSFKDPNISPIVCALVSLMLVHCVTYFARTFCLALLIRLIDDVDLYVLCFVEFGKQFIKEQRISPDAFIQLALQLTYYKVHRRLVSTYESAGLGQYNFGRVDNIRSATTEALSWVKAMCDEIPEITVSTAA